MRLRLKLPKARYRAGDVAGGVEGVTGGEEREVGAVWRAKLGGRWRREAGRGVAVCGEGLVSSIDYDRRSRVVVGARRRNTHPATLPHTNKRSRAT